MKYLPAADSNVSGTKLGGQPTWMSEPQWPLSRSTGEQMWFIGQFEIIDASTLKRIVYVFMTDATENIDDAWEYDVGENAVIVQPDGRVPSFVSISPNSTGPSCGPAAVVADQDDPMPTFLNRIGGSPSWLQADETPDGEWCFVAQLDSRDLPFEVNFGDAGSGYVFVSADACEGRFLWQGW